MPVTTVVGANWGDKGKGKITDVLAAQADFVVRFQGGSNAGHTIVNEHGKFVLHLLPSSVFHDDVVNVLGPGVAVDVPVLLAELEHLRASGVHATGGADLRPNSTIACSTVIRRAQPWIERRCMRPSSNCADSSRRYGRVPDSATTASLEASSQSTNSARRGSKLQPEHARARQLKDSPVLSVRRRNRASTHTACRRARGRQLRHDRCNSSSRSAIEHQARWW